MSGLRQAAAEGATELSVLQDRIGEVLMSEKMIREFSSGAVVLRKLRGAWHIAVIEPRTRYGDNNVPAKRIIALPKGNIDHGETPAEAALREVREETGIEGTLVDKLVDIKYFYRRGWHDNARVF